MPIGGLIAGEYWEKLVASPSTMDAPIESKQDCSRDESTSRVEHLELFDDDSPHEEGFQDLAIEEETHEEVFEAQSSVPTSIIEDSPSEEEIEDLVIEDKSQVKVYEFKSIEPPLVSEYYIYEDPMWPTPPPPTSYQAYPHKPSHVERTCQNFSNQAKLEDIKKQDPFVVLYDTYYGRKPLFDERLSKSQADDFKSSASWEATCC